MNLVKNKEGLLFEVADSDLDNFLSNGWAKVDDSEENVPEEAPKPAKRATKKK